MIPQMLGISEKSLFIGQLYGNELKNIIIKSISVSLARKRVGFLTNLTVTLKLMMLLWYYRIPTLN